MQLRLCGPDLFIAGEGYFRIVCPPLLMRWLPLHCACERLRWRSERILTTRGWSRGKHGETYVGIDVANLKNAIAIAEVGGEGKVRFFDEVDAMSTSMRGSLKRFPADLIACFSANRLARLAMVYRLVRSLGNNGLSLHLRTSPRRPRAFILCALWHLQSFMRRAHRLAQE